MKYAWSPENEAPFWYRERWQKQSAIEKQFEDSLGELAKAIESEHWFGDKEKHGRYRVDFILKDARLIIELDGHDYHSSKEQLQKDAIRQRYLKRSWYSVIRFTGSEIYQNVKSCVEEVRTIYKEIIQRSPAKYRVMYIDYPFLLDQMEQALVIFKKINPDKKLFLPPIEEIILHAIEWLHEKSFITVFIFHPPEYAEKLKHLNNFIKEYKKWEIRINTIEEELYSYYLGEHITTYSHLFDEFFLIADDFIYVNPLYSVLPKELKSMEKFPMHKYLWNAKLLRKDNDSTAYAGTELANVLWQNIQYIIGASMGLSLYEM